MKRVIFAILALCGLLWAESAQAQRALTVWKDGQPSIVVEPDSVYFWKVPAEAIDLGLPSGTKWASCNVGATRPEEYGGYYAWGETAEKEWYDWSTYIHCDGSESTCHDLGSCISGTQYDVAYVTWLGKWRMPTIDEIKELIDNCTSEWAREVGVNGRKFTGPNGNSIFLPAAGDRWEDVLDNNRRYGRYWSGTIESGNSVNAYGLSFRSGTNVNQSLDYRSNGFSVRPVLLEYALLALSTDAVSFEVGVTETVQITAGSGDYSCASDDPSIVTATLDGSTLTLTALKAGETHIVVTDNKTLKTAAIAVSVTEPIGDIIVTVSGVSFKMVKVEGDTFQMGATAEQGSDAYDREKPVHSVTLSDYSIGETEVTQALWQAVMGSNPSNFTGDLQRPVENVSWNDCQAFITKLNELTGMLFRLPTEAEWEFAARGGNSSQGYVYAGSNTIGDVAWYNPNSSSKTHPVATKAPNELGLYDMSGNVWEWCQDWYGSYSSDAQTNPQGPSSGSDRVLRGGGWGSNARSCRVSCRGDDTPSDRGSLGGLRLAL